MIPRARARSTLFALLVSAAVSPAAMASPPGGSLFIMDHQIDVKKDGWEKDLKKATKAALAKEGDGWHVFFVAYLKKAPGAPDVNLVFYGVDGGKREEANAFPIGTQPTAKILMSDVTVTGESGMKPGKYEVLITRLIDGKEEVYARSKVELK